MPLLPMGENNGAATIGLAYRAMAQLFDGLGIDPVDGAMAALRFADAVLWAAGVPEQPRNALAQAAAECLVAGSREELDAANRRGAAMIMRRQQAPWN